MDPIKRLEACKWLDPTAIYSLTISVLPSLIYIGLMPYTLWKHGKVIVQINKCLLISWFVEAIIAIIATLSNYYRNTHTESAFDDAFYWIIWDLLDEVNFVIFLQIIFRLKTL
jgi:hypothetical protein